ncbi:hypothetical protein FDENT_788 [Fusarium denticulatum]|uniref:Mid2 domain-containing protein n=1 Tax=Fusarium denticulatum TaxID=48507 RepID=A0A8H5XK54_9HYPO|nr:hypothetical protein FDENT_788 [Fusarium denticulatum]
MIIILILTLLLSLFANRALCGTTFLRPPEWKLNVDSKAGFGKNVRYRVGDAIQILWETDLDNVKLYLAQRIGSVDRYKVLDSSRTEWKAEWDVMGIVEGNEDSVYYFALNDRPDDLTSYVAATQYFNVTAPALETSTTSITAYITTSKTVGVSTTQLNPRPTVTVQSTNEEANSDTGHDSGMSKGEIAGAAVGGTIGGFALLGAVGWLIWRKLGRYQRKTDVSVVSQSHQGQVNYSETKAELPGDPAQETYPAGYARSPPGLHEAP